MRRAPRLPALHLGVAAMLLCAGGPAAAEGIACALTYACAIGTCTGGEISIRIETRDGQAGVVATGEEFFPVAALTDAATGWITYVTPVDNGGLYFMTVTPEGKALASGHEISTFDGSETVYAAVGTCRKLE